MCIIRGFGPECHFTVVDCEAGFRQIPIHPSCYHQQVIRWKGRYYVDHRLCFGSRASPFLYTTITQAIEYIIQQTLDEQLGQTEKGTRKAILVHFVDDFLCVCESEQVGKRAADIMMEVMELLGVPLADHKTQYNVQEGEYLGLYVNARTGTCRLPRDKAADLRNVLRPMVTGGATTIQQWRLESLIGKLTYAHVVFPWLRHAINPFLVAMGRMKHRFTRGNISPEMRESAELWDTAIWAGMDGRRPARSFATLPLALAAFELGVGGSANLSAYSGDAAGEVGFGFRDETGEELYFDQWLVAERASHTLGEQFVGPSGRMSSTLQEAKCMVAAGLTWLAKGQPPHSVFRYRTDSKNCFYLARKMRSKTEAVNKVWSVLASHMDRAGCAIDVIWQSRETADAKLSDMLSRCPSSPAALQEYRLASGRQQAARLEIHPSVRLLIRA